MKKANIIKKSSDFNRIIKKRKGFYNECFIINIDENNTEKTKFGITFVKNLCNAVKRNKLKRQVKSILDNNKNIYENGKNYIIIIKRASLDKTYQELEKNLKELFLKIKEKK